MTATGSYNIQDMGEYPDTDLPVSNNVAKRPLIDRVKSKNFKDR